MSTIRCKAPSTHGDKHWTHRHPEWLRRGESHPAAKLTAKRVRAMRRLRDMGTTITAIAAAFDVDRTTVRRALRGQTWRHV